MTSVFLVLIVFFVIYLKYNYKNKITRAFAVYLTSVGLLLFSSLLYFAKLSNYPFSSKIDYYLYIFLMDVKLNIPDISRIYNVGVALIFITSVIISANISKLRKSSYILFSLPIIYYMWINDPTTSYNHYLDTAMTGEKNLMSFFLDYNYIISPAIFTMYIIIPFISLFKYYAGTKIKLKKRSTLITALWLLIIDIYTVSVFVTGSFGMFFSSNLTVFKFPKVLVSWNYYILIPLTIFIIILLFFIVYFYKPFSNFNMISQRKMKQNYNVLSKNFRMLFHVYKNLFFTIDRLAEQGEKNIETNPELSRKNYGKIREISGDSVQTISRMLDMMHDIKFQFEAIDIKECIDKAIESTDIPNYITINKAYHMDLQKFYADRFHFTEVFKNMINNSVEAIILKKEISETDFSPYINITVSSEDDMLIIEIEDNGNGIEKKNLKNIFSPLFSTKQSMKNWGIGLNYVYNVISIHSGNISADSQLGEYTKFEILLPKLNERKMRKYEKNKISYL